MENLERFENLSSAEIATLETRKRFVLMLLLGVPAFLLVAHAGLALLSGQWFYLLISFLLTTSAAVLGLRDFLKRLIALNADLREGKKKIVVSRIESQRQDIRQGGDSDDPRMVYTYLLKTSGRELKVSEEQYYQCKPGQLVEIEIAPHSENVFAVCVLEDAAAAPQPATPADPTVGEVRQ